ncbi:ATP synthase F1 subunit delta [Cryomorpha ignava]|uniref:ATP synthase subunit delta n=1 Tax=Cryomorpha ignava TaxID=101383 RepID=A0A7K3WS92_9FLAO|nr:ATP synthase F1 subunit delta [Cryomorpha ignava]NEN24543.1 ATP synthase F1 subunit delta [Cryomorpha ignava]
MQQDSQVAIRYAKSLLDFALERKELEAVAADMALISQTCSNSKDLRQMLKSPIIKPEKKLTVIKEIFGGEIGSVTLNFLGVIAGKKRENILPEIANAFTTVYRKHLGIVSAEITSAVALSDNEREKAIAVVQGMGTGKVKLIEKIDKNIIGGFIIRVDDKQYDASVASRITALKRTFSKNHLQ